MNNFNTDGTAIPYRPTPSQHAELTYSELLSLSSTTPGHAPTRPLDFPTPYVKRGVRMKVLAFHPRSGERRLVTAIQRTEFLPGGGSSGSSSVPQSQQQSKETPPPSPRFVPPDMVSSPPPSQHNNNNSVSTPDPSTYIAYWPQRRLQDAIYGCVLACVVLIKYNGEAADDAARAAGYEPGHPLAPVVWEITDRHVAIKQVEWRRVHAMRGRLLEDPIKEIAALQLIGNDHPNVLGSSEVLQDNEYLYSVMPYCRGGDLFGIVLAAAEERQANEELMGAGGMSEPTARYWFRQLLFGLHYLQSKGICHRDLSLENILVDVHHCLVIDMGMCLRVPYYCPDHPEASVDVTRGTVRRFITPMGTCGKKNYMSPEIFANKTIFDGFAVDLWSAGVILYIMVTGFPPYDMPSREDERFQIIYNGDLMKQLEAWEIYLSESCGHLLQWMLSPNPADRPTLAQVMMHEWVVDGEIQPPVPHNF